MKRKFEIGDRVAAYGYDEATRWFATGKKNPYRVIGTVVRTPCHGTHKLVKVEIDNSGSQDSEGHNAVVVYHVKQLRRLKSKAPA